MDSGKRWREDVQSVLQGHEGPINKKQADQITEATYEHANRTGTVKEFSSRFDSTSSNLAIKSLVQADE
jgi:hypothetical protein